MTATDTPVPLPQPLSQDQIPEITENEPVQTKIIVSLVLELTGLHEDSHVPLFSHP